MSRLTTLIAELESARVKFKELLHRVQPATWDLAVHDDGQSWTARQILIHIMDAQRGMLMQITRIQAGQETVSPTFDLNRWNNRQVEKNAAKTVEGLIDELTSDRERLIETLHGLSEADLDKEGRHGSGMIMSIEQIARLVGQHELAHIETIIAAQA